MDRHTTYISMTISPVAGVEGLSDKIVGVLAGLVKRSPEHVRLALETGSLKLTKVAVGSDLDRLVSVLERRGLKVTTLPWREENTVRSQGSEPVKEATVRSGLPVSPKRGSTDWKKGDLIEGLYEVLGSAAGGMGKVHFVFHRLWKMMLAIKTPLEAAVKSEMQVLRFLREAELWVDLGVHPNIATCYYARVINGLPRLFIEYVDGGTLDEWHEKGRLKDMKLLLDLALQFCHGMSYAEEKGMIHRDIKPANCLISRDKALKITDFGLVKRVEDPAGGTDSSDHDADTSGSVDAKLTLQEHGIIGSPWYMPPERFIAKGLEDIRSDVYSFGVMLYQLSVEAMPFRFPEGFSIRSLVRSHVRVPPVDPLEVRPDLPQSLARVILTCLEKKPDNRYPSFVDVCRALEEVLREVRPGREPRRRPNIVGLKADSLNNQAVSLLDLGREDEAVRLLEDAHSANPEHLEAVYNLHAIRWARGETSDLEVMARLKSLRIEVRESPDCRHLTGLVALQRGDPDEAVPLLRRAAQESGQYMDRWSGHGGDPKRFVDSLGYTAIAQAGSYAGHLKAVLGAALDPSGKRAFSVGQDRSVRIWDVESGRCLTNLRTFTFMPVAASFSRDASFVATAYGDAFKTVDLWDLVEGKLRRRYKGPGVTALCFSPDAGCLAALGTDGRIRGLDTASEQVLWEIRDTSGKIEAQAFSGDGLGLLLGGSDGTLELRDVRSGEAVFRVVAHDGPLQSLAVSDDGALVLTAGVDETVRIFSAHNGEEHARLTGHRGPVVRALWMNPGSHAASASSDGTVKIWDSAAGRCFRTVTDTQEEPAGLAVSRDGKQLLVTGTKGSVKLWKVDTGWFEMNFLEPALCRPRTFRELVSLHASFSLSVEDFNRAWRREDRQAAMEAFERMRGTPGFCWSKEAIICRNMLAETARRKHLLSTAFIRSLYGNEGPVTSLSAGADSLMLAGGGVDGTARLWDVVTGRVLRRFDIGSPVGRVFLLPRLQGLITWSADKVLRKWDLSGKSVMEIPETELPASLTSDGTGIAVMSTDRAAWLIATDTGGTSQKGVRIPGKDFICFADDINSVYSVRDGTLIQRWSLATGRIEGAFRDVGIGITALAVAPDGERVVAGTDAGDLLVYMPRSSMNMGNLRGHRSAVRALTPGMGEDLWVSGSDDCSVRVWDLASQTCAAVLEGHSSPVRAVSFFPNSSLIASAGTDGSIRLWGLEWDFSFR